MNEPQESSSRTEPNPAERADRRSGPSPEPSRFRIRAIYDEVVSTDRVDLVLMLTLILLIVRPGPKESWYLSIPLTLLSLLPLLCRPLLRNSQFWAVLTLLLVVVHAGFHWHTSDNHKFLVSFWCIAVTCSLVLRDSDAALALNGRLLVGLVFLFATIWKATSLPYLNGDTFYFLLLTDTRFYSLSYGLGGMPWEVFKANQDAIALLGSLPETVELQSVSTLPALARFLTWWTVIVEGVIALLFLIPRGDRVERLRHGVLLVFLASTYPPTSVIQFGWILIIMALASCPHDWRRTRFAYVLVFFFIFCFSTGSIWEHFQQWVRAG